MLGDGDLFQPNSTLFWWFCVAVKPTEHPAAQQTQVSGFLQWNGGDRANRCKPRRVQKTKGAGVGWVRCSQSRWAYEPQHHQSHWDQWRRLYNTPTPLHLTTSLTAAIMNRSCSGCHLKVGVFPCAFCFPHTSLGPVCSHTPRRYVWAQSESQSALTEAVPPVELISTPQD